MKQRRIYNIVNIFILLVTAVLFCFNYWNDRQMEHYWLLGIMALMVYAVKGFRLYFILLGQGMSFRQYLKQYCKVIPVSIILPFKLGELFRIYCYGYHIKSYFNALVIILLDRFVDTLALVCVVLFCAILNGSSINGIIYLLILFLICIIVMYLLFPEIYRFWKHYFLVRPATKKGNRMLELLEYGNQAYNGISRIAGGKSIILFILSVIAWGVEIGGILLLNRMGSMGNESEIILNYLSSALNGQENTFLQQFVIVSVLLMLCVYVLLHLYTRVRKER